MKLSDIFKFKLFEGGDKANLKIVNENFEIAEKELDATNKEITDKVTEINDRITELNNLLGGKLDVTKIANNLVTTEEGYALDARMGKALSDDLVAKTTLCNKHFGGFGGDNSVETRKIILSNPYQIFFIVDNFNLSFAVVCFKNGSAPIITYVFGNNGINISVIDSFTANISSGVYCQINLISNLPFTLE